MDVYCAETILHNLARNKKIAGREYSFGHVKNVALLARRIAEVCGFDTEKAYILGLLHDVGRFFVLDEKQEIDVNDQHRHLIEGYKYLYQEGYEKEAKICISHALIFHKNVYFDKYTDEENKIVSKILAAEYDIYDLVIQLSDEMSIIDGWCSLETRFARDAIQKGYRVEDWKKFLCLREIKLMFDNLAKQDIYGLILDNIWFA